MPKIWKEMRIHLKGSSHVRNLPVFGKTLGFPPVSTSFPGPNPPGTVSSGATMAAAEKAGATSFAAMAKGAADWTPSFDVVSVWLDVWCRFFVLVCFDYGSFLYVWGNCVGSHMVLHHGNQAGVCDAFRLLHWSLAVLGLFHGHFPNLGASNIKQGHRANPRHPTQKIVFLGFWLKMTPMTNQIAVY